jgi:nicotinate phosphoribosyltransferase
MHHPTDSTKSQIYGASRISDIEPLLVEIMREGHQVYTPPSLDQIRERRHADLERLDSGVKRFMNPHIYHVSVSERLWNRKQQLIQTLREHTAE